MIALETKVLENLVILGQVPHSTRFLKLIIRMNSKTLLENAFYIHLLYLISLPVLIRVDIALWFYSILKQIEC